MSLRVCFAHTAFDHGKVSGGQGLAMSRLGSAVTMIMTTFHVLMVPFRTAPFDLLECSSS